MHTRAVRRALAAGLSLTIVAAGFVAADVLEPSGDTVMPGGTILQLGTAAPGQTIQRTVPVSLVCSNSQHAARESVVSIVKTFEILPAAGGSITVTGTTIGPIPASWPLSGSSCGTPVPTMAAATPVAVTVVTPLEPGTHQFLFGLGASGASGVGSTSVAANVTVVGNTAPSLQLPSDFTVEGDVHGGWASTWTASATDAEDASPPAVSCTPSAGTVLPLGATTVSCATTDTGGATTSGGFVVTVTDTTAPTISGLPTSIQVDATSASGAAVTWPEPAANDLVDPEAAVACEPASGTVFGIGTTTVSCTGRDATGNASYAQFPVTVTRRHVLSATWGEPVGSGSPVTANFGRTIPLKVSAVLDGQPVGSDGGVVVLLDRLAACGGSAAARVAGPALAWDGGRWTGNLDTSSLSVGCWRVSIGVAAAESVGFELRLVEGAVGSSASTVTKRGNGGR